MLAPRCFRRGISDSRAQVWPALRPAVGALKLAARLDVAGIRRRVQHIASAMRRCDYCTPRNTLADPDGAAAGSARRRQRPNP